LVKFNTQYAIIGELQNIDNIPADVVIKATLYNDQDMELAQYNAKYHVKHKLMPKETTVFKINFEGIAWSSAGETAPSTFDPDQFTEIEFREEPTKFNLQCGANIAYSDLYKGLVLQQIEFTGREIEGVLFNSGIQEVTIPQLLISYYDDSKELIWVDHKFLTEGAKIQRKQNFTFSPKDLTRLEVVNSSLQNCYVNGLSNDEISAKSLLQRDTAHTNSLLQPYSGNGFDFIKIEMNNYIGNPN
jgi:hypothetical protein